MKKLLQHILAGAWFAVALDQALAQAPVPAAPAPATSNGLIGPSVTPPAPSEVATDTSYFPAGEPAAADPVRHLFSQEDRFRVRGWLNGGYMGNTSSPASRFNGPYNAIDRDELMFNQAYLIAEAPLPTDGSFGFGARTDVLYGFDYILGQSLGLEVNPNATSRWNSNEYYGLAMPQAYGELGSEQLSAKGRPLLFHRWLRGAAGPRQFLLHEILQLPVCRPVHPLGRVGHLEA